MAIKIDCHGESHIGQRRSDNEDQFFIADLNKSMRIHETSLGLRDHSRLYGGSQGKLLLVADGLGGSEGGERASTLAVDGVSNYILNTMDWCFGLTDENSSHFMDELTRSFVHSQSMIDAEAEAIPQRRGMATTLTMAYIQWPQLYIVHVGDTRCYLIRDGEIKQLTTDHTIAELVRSVEAEMDTAPTTPEPNSAMNQALWNVVGGPRSELHPQVHHLKLERDDSLLLCSDGLTRYVEDQELLEGVLQDKPVTQICHEFIDLANSRGGRDNITAILARINESDPSSASTADVPAVSPDDPDDTLEVSKTA